MIERARGGAWVGRVLSKTIKCGYGLKYANYAFKSNIRVSVRIEYGKMFF